MSSNRDQLWLHKEEDINAALKIIKEHAEQEGQIKLMDSFEDNGQSLKITMPKWQVDLSRYFVPLYGEQAGEVISQAIFIIFQDVLGPTPDEMKQNEKFIRIT